VSACLPPTPLPATPLLPRLVMLQSVVFYLRYLPKLTHRCLRTRTHQMDY
jgi:hypothetical protein